MSTVKEARELCIDLLPGVSRTFAMTIPVLSEELRSPIACSYLLCRIADNIEDHPDLSDTTKEKLFTQFLNGLKGEAAEHFYKEWPEGVGKSLAENYPVILFAYRSFPEEQQGMIEACVKEMVSGMQTIILHRTPERKDRICKTIEELEEYCHYVAGIVGIMLYQIFSDFLGSEPDEEKEKAAHQFGLGLQLTNILQDRNEDALRGISFLPPGNLDPVFQRALQHLEEGHEYALSLPPHQEGLRLFCLWALWMAIATLEEVIQSDAQRPKIDRARVEEILTYTQTHVRNNETLRSRFQSDRLRTTNRLSQSELVK
jgi:farnesyl-diphosphate farnesyltransferase